MPTALQAAELESRLAYYMQAAKNHQMGRLGDRPDLALAQATVPQIKCGVVSHTTVTFYNLGVADINRVRVPASGNRRVPGPPAPPKAGAGAGAGAGGRR
jgi:hypothetical protein